jgi:predicted TIM-barrel fold metal-dependent hydrolase
MEIFANHAHIYQDGVIKNGSIDALKRLMDECEISGAVAFAPLPPDYRNDEGIHQNEWLARQIKNEPNIVGFGVIDFAIGNLRDQVDQLYQLGMKGIKIHPAEQKLKIDCPAAFEVYGRAEELGLVVSFHTGVHWHRIADYSMLLYDEVGYHFPALRYTLEHVGGYSFFTEAMAVLVNSGNTFAGLTSVFDTGVNKFWYLDDQKIKDLMWMIGPSRCIFGLDSPWNDATKVKYAIEKIKSLDLPEKDVAGILGGNLKALLKL